MLRETSLGAADASELLERTLRPLIRDMRAWSLEPHSAPATTRRDLCAACPMAVPCAETYPERLAPRDDPPAGASRPRPNPTGAMSAAAPMSVADPTPTDDDGRREAESLKDRILAELTKQGFRGFAGATLEEAAGPIKSVDEARAAEADEVFMIAPLQGG